MGKTLNDRVLEAKALAREGKITSRDKQGRAKVIYVPGSKATINQVTLRRHNGGKISAECRKDLNGKGFSDCLGNKAGVCRHSIAAVILAMEDAGYKPYFRRDKQLAQDFANRISDTVVSGHDGDPLVMTLLSFQNINNKLYFVPEEQAAAELKAA